MLFRPPPSERRPPAASEIDAHSAYTRARHRWPILCQHRGDNHPHHDAEHTFSFLACDFVVYFTFSFSPLLNNIFFFTNLNFVAGVRVIWAHAPGRVDFAADKNANSTLPHDNVLKLILSLVDGLSPRLLFSLNVVQTLILLSILLSWVR